MSKKSTQKHRTPKNSASKHGGEDQGRGSRAMFLRAGINSLVLGFFILIVAMIVAAATGSGTAETVLGVAGGAAMAVGVVLLIYGFLRTADQDSARVKGRPVKRT